MNIIKIVYSLIFLWVGIITLSVSLKFLSAKEFFPYHKEASKMEWNEISKPLQTIILAVMRMAGLGILFASLTIIFYSGFIFLNSNSNIKYFVPIVSLIFWAGTFLVTFRVHKKTMAHTPWKGSLSCMIMLIAAILISIF